jgi:hypothetical protein
MSSEFEGTQVPEQRTGAALAPTRSAFLLVLERAALLAMAATGTVSVLACDNVRKQECDKFLGAVRPLDEGTPTLETVQRVQKDLGAIAFQDAPLSVYAKNYGAKLTVLSNTLALKAGPDAPDGTDAVIKQNLKSARTDRQDVQRYCSQ